MGVSVALGASPAGTHADTRSNPIKIAKIVLLITSSLGFLAWEEFYHVETMFSAPNHDAFLTRIKLVPGRRQNEFSVMEINVGIVARLPSTCDKLVWRSTGVLTLAQRVLDWNPADPVAP
jgi:hypothetical protein